MMALAGRGRWRRRAEQGGGSIRFIDWAKMGPKIDPRGHWKKNCKIADPKNQETKFAQPLMKPLLL